KLAGEGLQHQDGNSQLLAYPVPNLLAYDPAFAYEIAVIVQDGLRRMYQNDESIFYYITVMNEPYEMLAMPEGSREGILRGMYGVRASESKGSNAPRAQLLGSGAILWEVLKAQQLLQEKYGVAADVWSVTSYKELYKDGITCERWNLLHPDDKQQHVPFVTQSLKDAPGPIVAASDYVKTLPLSISRWCPRPIVALG